jgi:nitronate monooxygenase
VRVIGNSVTAKLGFELLGHDPEKLPREVIGHEGERPLYRYSTDSPLRITTGDLEAMALFAGQSAGAITDIIPAGERLRRIMAEAEACLARLSPKERKS